MTLQQSVSSWTRWRAFGIAACLALMVAGASRAAELPDFSLRTIDGENQKLSEHRGEVVVLGFWARWCGDCRQAMQALSALYEKYERSGLVMWGINVGDSAEQAAAMSRSLGLSFSTLVDPGKTVSEQFNLGKMPLVVLIDRDGVVRFSHGGYERGDDVLIANQLRQLINE
jgi:peroxiredoxin